MTHKQRVLALLSDGLPHSHLEGYRLGVMLHSRAADLRRDGHDIRVTREGESYVYRLVAPLGEVDAGPGGSTQASASPSAEAAPPDRGSVTAAGITLGAQLTIGTS